MLIIAENRKARHDYHILEAVEAGLVLTGSEVKSLRDRQVQLKDSYVHFKDKEAFLYKAHISIYKQSSYNNHEPERPRKLLLSRKQLNHFYDSIREKGLSCVPLKLYFKEGRAKIEIALVKGKKNHDKRDAIKSKDIKRSMDRAMRK
jgi:SsrA-binding protein